MASQNGTHSSPTLHQRLDAVASNLKNAVHRVSAAASSLRHRASDVVQQPAARAGSFAARAREVIQAHPIAAIGITLGSGYLLVRWLRR